ncbi:MAG: hypothetical protein V2B20_25975 [Pseudomonadota bacterium]
MPREKWLMCWGNPPEFQAICQLQDGALACFKASGADNFTAFRKGYQSPVKQGIQIRDKQESIEYIQPFLVGVQIPDDPGHGFHSIPATHSI